MIGTTLLHYEIIDLIGRGGMGEVYRARDTKLDREVAIKVLPAEMSGDPERLARFEREARVLATLQHPHIASIYDFDKADETRFLVMELVDGEDLGERLKRGPVPVEEALELAIQLAEGLEAAHTEGIIHRDLKPANVKVSTEGTLKILDFGLARAYTGDTGTDSAVEDSPTITAAMTRAGVILGTAAYMSPEQARGKRADQRADLWAFGVILWEMLLGRSLFSGDTVSDTLAAVLRADVDWDTLPDDTPPNIRRLLRRCLQRNPKNRLHSAADARLELAEEATEPRAERSGRRSFLLPLALGALATALVVSAWIFGAGQERQRVREPVHLSLTLPDGLQIASPDALPLGAPQPCLAISTDGKLVLAVVEHDDATWLYRHFLDRPEGEVVEGTRGAYMPRISPGGTWISFMSGNTLMRMAADGSLATRVLDIPNSFGHEWINEDEIVVTRAEATSLVRVGVDRGTHTEIASASANDAYHWPSRIDGTSSILYNSNSHVAKTNETRIDEVSLLDLATGERSVVGIGGSIPKRLPGGPLLLIRNGVLAAAPFDLDSPEVPVQPTTVLEGLLVEGWVGQYAVSDTGIMVYAPGGWLGGTELVWADAGGEVEPLGFGPGIHGDFELSPDGTRLAITQGDVVNPNVWFYDLERRTRRLVSTEKPGGFPVWSPDGSEIVYSSQQGEKPGLYRKILGSNSPAEFLAAINGAPYAWHENVGLLVNHQPNGRDGDIYRLDPEAPGDLAPLVATNASEWGPDISPDGQWIAYTSDESGRYEVYARAIASDRSWSISTDGGEEPLFAADGKSIFYRNGNRFYETPILDASEDGSRFRAGAPSLVVEGAYSNVPGLSYALGRDGRLLLLRNMGGSERPGHLNVILNWDVELERKLSESR